MTQAPALYHEFVYELVKHAKSRPSPKRGIEFNPCG